MDKTKIMAVAVLFALMCGVAADVDVDTTIISDGNVDSTNNVIADGNIRSDNNLQAGGDVDIYFNGVNWDDVPTVTHEIKVESNVDASLGAFQSMLHVIADYRTGEKKELEYAQYKVLTDFMRLTDAELMTFYGQMIAPDFYVINATLDNHRSMILDNLKLIQANARDIVETREALQATMYQVEAIDLTLKKMDKETYCSTLVEVMDSHGFKRVKCDIGSRLCYNGKQFSFEGGRDYCIEIDDQEMPPTCYKTSTCAKIGEITKISGEGEQHIFVDFTNPSDELRTATFKMLISDDSGAIVSKCEQNQEGILPHATVKLRFNCSTADIKPGAYLGKILVGAEGLEILDEVKFNVHAPSPTTTLPPTTTTLPKVERDEPSIIGAAAGIGGGGNLSSTLLGILMGVVLLAVFLASVREIRKNKPDNKPDNKSGGLNYGA